MKTQGGPSKEEESLKALLRKIRSLDSKFSSKVDIEWLKKSFKNSIDALSTAKELETEVLEELAKSVRKIDDFIESYEHRTAPQSNVQALSEDDKLDKIISDCIQQIQNHMALLERKQISGENDNRVNETRVFEPPEHWLKAAEENVEGKLQVTAPDMRYNDLELPLRRCLLFFSVFPKDAVIHKRSIIYWWIGEGLVKQNKTQTAEQAGKRCFEMLLLNGLILPISKKHDKKARCCKMHSSVREMLISEVERTDLCFENYSNKRLTGKDSECPLSCLAVTEDNQQSVVVSLEHKTHELLSLFNISAQYLVCESSKFSTFHSIKVLQLGRWKISSDHHIEVADTKFLESLGVMKNLRYLSLQGISRITMLSDSLVHLTNLQILDLRACHNLETLPTGIGSLKHLTHLDVSECSLLDGIPKGLGSLSELQVLKGFIISRSITSDTCRLKDLTGLQNLRKLSINIAREAKADDDLMELMTFKKLSSLTIAWGQATNMSSQISLPNLEKLDLQGFPEENLECLKLELFSSLKKLYIRGGKLKSINLGTDPGKCNVETLRLKFLRELEWNHWTEIKNAFPCLACIEIFKCPKLDAKPASLPPFHDDDRVWMMKNERNSSDMPSSSSMVCVD